MLYFCSNLIHNFVLFTWQNQSSFSWWRNTTCTVCMSLEIKTNRLSPFFSVVLSLQKISEWKGEDLINAHFLFSYLWLFPGVCWKDMTYSSRGFDWSFCSWLSIFHFLTLLSFCVWVCLISVLLISFSLVSKPTLLCFYSEVLGLIGCDRLYPFSLT